MEKFQVLPIRKVEFIDSVTSGLPSFASGHLSFFPVGQENIFDNQQLSSKTITKGIWLSGGLAYCYEIVRNGGDNLLDIDKHFFSLSGAIILIDKIPYKDFPEHHSSGLPHWYN